MINVNNAPSIFGESPKRKSNYVGLDALKDKHVSFNGYGISEDDVITFPTRAEFDAAPKKFIKTIPTYDGSPNTSVLFLVDRNGRESWLNLSVLTRTGYAEEIDPEGNTVYKRAEIDDFRKEMNAMNDDKERVEYLFGKQIMGGAPRTDLYAQNFGRDPEDKKTYRKPLGTYNLYPYVTLDVAERPDEKPAAEGKKGKKDKKDE